jgi:hypothetical protein
MVRVSYVTDSIGLLTLETFTPFNAIALPIKASEEAMNRKG